MSFVHELAYHQVGRVSSVQHRHTDSNTLEFIQILSGNGNALIGDKTYPLAPGTMLFIDATYIHAINPQDSSNYKRNKLIVDKQMLYSILQLLKDQTPLHIFSGGGSCFLPTQTQAAEIDAVFRGLHTDTHRESDALCTVLQLLHFVHKQPGAAPPQTDPRITHVLQYIHTHYAEPLTVDQIAAETLLSKYYLCHLFRTHTGITVMQYLNEQRLSFARVLLSDSDQPIAEIAQNCGFGSSSHFCTAFRTREGISPREFRITHRKK